jgi:hypothetical protein
LESGFYAIDADDGENKNWSTCRMNCHKWYYWDTRAGAVISGYNGPSEEGGKVMARLLQCVPEPVFNRMSTMPFPAMQVL